MQVTGVLFLADWHNFYSIIGSAAATLMGLMFVVITLMVGIRRRVTAPGSAIAIFSTPNVVHFGIALLIAALLSAPWNVLWPVSLLLGLVGLGGAIYVLRIFWQFRHRLSNYQPVLEDWLWHVTFPLVSYTALIVAAIVLSSFPKLALFVIATVAVLFLFIGIHNAWDAVTYTAIGLFQPQDKSQN